MSELVRYIIGAVLLLSGMASMGISVFGVFWFRFVMNRMQAAAIIDTLNKGKSLQDLLRPASRIKEMVTLYRGSVSC